MEKKKKKLPIGIENFEKLRTENFYYVDKTNLIKICLITGLRSIFLQDPEDLESP